MDLHLWADLAVGALVLLTLIVSVGLYSLRRPAPGPDETVVVRRFIGLPRREHVKMTEAEQPVKAAELHELRLNSVENTEGRRVGVFTCVLCAHSHIERRELEPVSDPSA